jgi:membrane associated rhomboid family serine protease
MLISASVLSRRLIDCRICTQRNRGFHVTFFLAILGGLLGLILGWIATAAATLIIGSATGVSNAEGAFAMGAIFFIGPVGGLIGLILGIWLVIRLRRNRPHAAKAGE